MSGPLILGVDGGGSKTAAVLATLDESGGTRVLGRGGAGSSNLRAAGKEKGLSNLDRAVAESFFDAGIEPAALDIAVLALAASTQPDIQGAVREWSDRKRLAQRVEICHDSDPVLAAGTPDGWGVAVIAGTGSVAVGRDEQGNKLLRGGWGHWFSDAGSGYYLGRRALTAASESEDGVAPATSIHGLLLKHFEVAELRQVPKIIAEAENRNRLIASATAVVLEAAEGGDQVALGILAEGALKLSALATSAAAALGFGEGWPLAMTGGVIAGSESYREMLLEGVRASNPAPGPVAVVEEPVMGCIEIARGLLK